MYCTLAKFLGESSKSGAEKFQGFGEVYSEEPEEIVHLMDRFCCMVYKGILQKQETVCLHSQDNLPRAITPSSIL